jgi:hypothetical protein
MALNEPTLSSATATVPGVNYVCRDGTIDDGTGRLVTCPAAIFTVTALIAAQTDGTTSVCSIDYIGRRSAGPFGVGRDDPFG